MAKGKKRAHNHKCPNCYFDRFQTKPTHFPLCSKIVCRKCGQYIKTVVNKVNG